MTKPASEDSLYGLPRKTVEDIRKIFARFPEIDRAVLYGSRAKGTPRPGSDIDLTLHLTDGKTLKFLHKVSSALEDLGLPWGVDLSLIDYIENESLLDHIERVGVEFYSAAAYRAEQAQLRKRKTYETEGIQSEAQLEENLIKRLQGLGWERVSINNADALRTNLKRQLEIHNEKELKGQTLSEAEFTRVLSHLDKGNVFQRAKTLRDRFLLHRDDGSTCYLQFLNVEHWCRNQYQVTRQVSQNGRYLNRYDVTLLINGLPLAQIELKRRGIELKEAFNQINRYQRHSFWAENGLFNYVQLFVISNGKNTKYYANNRKQEFKQTFYWARENNQPVTQLDQFADLFLEKCHLSKMICKYIVLHESHKLLMVLRPYQYYAVEAIVERVKNGRKNGYIWHTTGSGKTLTSFKAAQILTHLPKVYKVVFVVDRADLDYQTTEEFNFFSPGSVDGTDNTRTLVKQMAGDNSLIVTTIQKLNTAIKKPRHEKAMEALRDKRVVFIFDECHRSQFGDTHKNIVNYFTKAQLFGFTGTPIFAENATFNKHGKRTTKSLFEKCLHKYVITDAIRDENVLKFSVEYWGKLKRRDGTLIDEQVASIDKKAFFENEARLTGVVDWIIAHHNRKTHNRRFSAIMCAGNVATLTRYYDIFKRKKQAGEHDLRVVSVFTFDPNEEDQDANGLIGEPDFDIRVDAPESRHSREKLEEYVADYNALYRTQHSVRDSKAFYTYYKDIAKRFKEREKESFKDKDRADILLVVNMFLTGFDAKKINTLYVDKNLKYHGLIQAYSRTNRILGELKSQGNIVCFRNLKENTDEAIRLFCDTEASEDVLMEPYEVYMERFNQGVRHLLEIAATPDAVNGLFTEEEQLAYVKAFRQLIVTLNKLKPFNDFSWSDLELTEQRFEDYKSKYLDIYDRTHAWQEGASIIEEIDFQLELIRRDEVNVGYIVKLLSDIQYRKQQTGSAQPGADSVRTVLEMLGREAQLRSKRELIERFIAEYMPQLTADQDLEEMFTGYWNREKRVAVNDLCRRERLDKEAVYRMMDEYHFSGKDPLRETVFSALEYKPKLMERKKVYSRVLGEMQGIIQRFDEGTGSLEVHEESAAYNSRPIHEVAHRIGDKELFFSDEINSNRNVTELVRFGLTVDRPYRERLESLSAYPLAGELLARGIVSDTILTEYFGLTAEFETVLKAYDFHFSEAENFRDGSVFWSLTEAREGSTVLEFALNAYGYTLVIGGPVLAFLALYGSASAGLETLQEHIRQRFGKSGEQNEPSVIINKDLEAEFRKIKEERNRSVQKTNKH
ncbi:type I restriction-modification system, restriction subunit [Syntrophotalea carbinolica DSM 2380]|uniref:Type I restriction enzyme endonuclease subunit n=1 Tax=Syntrophotalea carbinolica (strain DSM 2380 / NBRC 103641 / GraBd1) TaxID=338963 RepID=Q3A655_SYNC1|nr:HsdR family type I site-specific deoxyribonuclease [Syntrophotalea carbinolica]ABA88152.1 type I restriction-modification system, restriction subunit [Syntrophotalea carbinolica DSM 2380]